MKRSVLAVIVIVVIAAAAVLLTPVALAGAITVPVAQITFSEDTSGGSVTLGGPCYNGTNGGSVLSCGTAPSMTVYQYYFLTRPNGVLPSSDIKVNSTAGSTNFTIAILLATPSGQLVNVGNYSFSGGVGNRTHTAYLSVDQNVRASGTYTLTVTIDAHILLKGSTKVSTSANGFETTFKV